MKRVPAVVLGSWVAGRVRSFVKAVIGAIKVVDQREWVTICGVLATQPVDS